MGEAIGYILIPKQSSFNDNIPQEIISNIFSPYYLEVIETDINHYLFTPKDPNCIGIFKTENLIGISNIPLAESFFKENNENTILKFYQYFKKPEQFFILLQHDNQFDYGYCIISKGRLQRFYLSKKGDDRITSYGEPLEFESNWLNGTKEFNWNQEEEITNKRTNEKIYIESLSPTLLREASQLFTGKNAECLINENAENHLFRIYDKSSFKFAKFKQMFFRRVIQNPFGLFILIAILIFLSHGLSIYFSI